MRINVADLRRHPGNTETFSFSRKMAPITIGGENIRFREPVRVEGKIVSGRQRLAVSGEVWATVVRDCSRCLNSFERELRAPLEEVYVHASNSDSVDRPVEQVKLFSGEEIDLVDAVAEAIVLTLPMKAVCSEDCVGLCPRCGRNLKEGPCGCSEDTIDERLAVLKDILGNSRGPAD